MSIGLPRRVVTPSFQAQIDPWHRQRHHRQGPTHLGDFIGRQARHRPQTKICSLLEPLPAGLGKRLAVAVGGRGHENRHLNSGSQDRLSFGGQRTRRDAEEEPTCETYSVHRLSETAPLGSDYKWKVHGDEAFCGMGIPARQRSYESMGAESSAAFRSASSLTASFWSGDRPRNVRTTCM